MMPSRSWRRVLDRLSPGRKALRESEARYRDFFENVPDGVYETSLDGRILAANRALVRLLGCESADELMEEGRAEQFYVHPGDRDALTNELRRKGSLQNYELELVRRDGRRITVLENSRVVRDLEGRELYFQGTLTDITALKEAERESLLARDQALEASRLKSQFLANMSHELRTPLNAILGMARLLVDSNLGRSEREYAETVQHSAHFLLEIISQLLDFSSVDAGRLEFHSSVFRLRDVAEDAVSMLADRASSKGLELVCTIDGDVPEMVSGDPGRLRQVLTNLVGNAVKFTERGEVVLTVTRAKGRAGWTRFEVRDSGIGIPEKAHAIVFEPFRQADGSTTREYGGTGLGLAIAKQILDKMGGEIGFESKQGEGSRFWFQLALDAAPGCRAPRRMKPAVLAGKRALLLEPNAAAHAAISGWLRDWGVELSEDGAAEGCDFLVIATGALEGGRGIECPMPAPGTGRKPVCFLTAPVGERVNCVPGDTCRQTAVVHKPLRELHLLETLLRELSAKSEDTAAALRPLAEKLEEKRGGLVLVAEDNLVNQRVIRRMLEKLGYEVDVVENGHQVLEAIGKKRYALVLMDCQMPGMDGFKATTAIRGMAPPHCQLPIIAVTAHAILGDREMCIQAGMDDYITKPIMLDELGDVVERWIDRSAEAGTVRQERRTPAID